MITETPFALQARGVGTVNSGQFSLGPSKGAVMVVDVTARGTTGTVTVTLSRILGSAGTAVTVGATTALNAAGVTVLTFYPGITAAANASFNTILGQGTYRVSATVAGEAVTFGVEVRGVE